MSENVGKSANGGEIALTALTNFRVPVYWRDDGIFTAFHRPVYTKPSFLMVLLDPYLSLKVYIPLVLCSSVPFSSRLEVVRDPYFYTPSRRKTKSLGRSSFLAEWYLAATEAFHETRSESIFSSEPVESKLLRRPHA